MQQINPIGQLIAALLNVMKACGYVQKTGYNTFHRYSYAKEADVLDRFRPAMIENGLILIPSLDGEVTTDEHGNTHLVINYTLAHASGAVWPHPIRVPGCGNDKSAKTNQIGDKGVYKALTGANKYMMFKLFQIATGDDPEVDGPHEQEPPAPTKASRAKQEQTPVEQPDDELTLVQERPTGKPVGEGERIPAPAWNESAYIASLKAARQWAQIDEHAMLAEMRKKFPNVAAKNITAKQAKTLYDWAIANKAR